jgi:hypothetical protein
MRPIRGHGSFPRREKGVAFAPLPKQVDAITRQSVVYFSVLEGFWLEVCYNHKTQLRQELQPGITVADDT